MGEEMNIPPNQDRQPVPGIPATEGWKLMERQLDKALPTQSAPIPATMWEMVLYILIVTGALLAGSLVIISKAPSSSLTGKKAAENIYKESIENKSVFRATEKDSTEDIRKPKAKTDTALHNIKVPAQHKNGNTAGIKELSITGSTNLTRSSYKSVKEENQNRRVNDIDKAQSLITQDPVEIYFDKTKREIIIDDQTEYINKISANSISIDKFNYYSSHTTDTILLSVLNNVLLKELDSIKADHGATKNTGAKNKKAADKLLQGGIQFSAPVPINGTVYYFLGASAKNEFYRLLLPSFWITYSIKKNNISASFVPFMENDFPASPFKQLFRGAAPNLLSDTTLTLLKVFGMSGYASVTRSIGKHIRAGIGIGIASWSKGLIRWQRSQPNSAGVPYAIKKDTLYSISGSDSLWKYVNGSQLSIEAEVIYDLRSFQIGMKAGVPIKKPVNTGNTGYPVQSSLFFRYKFFGKQTK